VAEGDVAVQDYHVLLLLSGVFGLIGLYYGIRNSRKRSGRG